MFETDNVRLRTRLRRKQDIVQILLVGAPLDGSECPGESGAAPKNSSPSRS